MAKDDDRYEYVKGTYKTRRDRLHTNHGRPPVLGVGPFRDDGGHLDSHAEFILKGPRSSVRLL
jgi:hypothetical protein